MSIEFLVLILVILAGFASIFWFLIKKTKEEPREERSFLLLQNQMNEIMRTLDNRLGESTKMFQSQSGANTKIVQEVSERLVKIEEAAKQVVGVGGDIKNLEFILKNPKQRGVLGEYYLETLLKNILPPRNFQMQYAFADGSIVDAVVFVKDKIIPVDAKFSLENYNRIVVEKDQGTRDQLEKQFRQDLKDRIDETAKYVRPEEDTMDFAFMFIPAEAIYYDLLVNQIGAVKVNTQDLIQYAFKEKKVIIVSPTSFLAYLQTVMQGLRALQIEESAKEIRKGIENLRRHLKSYEMYLEKIGNHLGTTVGMYNSAYKEFGKIDKDVLKITGEGVDSSPQEIEKPKSTVES